MKSTTRNEVDKKELVFVCTINRHRSVIAANIFKKLVRDGNYDIAKKAVISSAGIVTDVQKRELRAQGTAIARPLFGYRPMPCVILYMQKKEGIDVSDYRSRPLTSKIANAADLVIAMGESHKQGILSTFPSTERKVFSLADLSYPFQFDDIVAEEPPGLMPPAKFCMLKCDHWDITDIVMDQIKERLEKALPEILNRLKI